MDALSDVLQAIRLSGAFFFDIRAFEPWVAETPPGEQVIGTMFPGSQHLIPYHVVTQGTCWGGLFDQPPMQLEANDVIVFPHGHAHFLASEPHLREAPDLSRYRRSDDVELPFNIAMGGNGSADSSTHFVCGFLGCDARPFNPLLSSLPPVFKISDREGGPLGSLIEFALAEMKRPRIGGESILDRLSELMFVEVLRRYLETLPPDRIGWLSGLRDPDVGRALAALHRDPAKDWSLNSLASEVGLSRSALAERFVELVGQPAMQYLANWRMQLAANRLRNTTDSVANIATHVGYESDAAFSRAFKKAVGVSPSQWREQERVAAG